MKHIQTLIFATSILFFASFAQADITTYNVDLSGVDELGSGLTVRVAGQITIDADLAVGMAVQSSTLTFQLGTDIIALPSVPNESYNDNFDASDMDWEDIGGDLFMTRTTSTGSNFFAWNTIDDLAPHRFLLGAGTESHRIERRDFLGTQTHLVTLKSPGGPDGPGGFLIGTAVPEPGSGVILFAIAGVTIVRRRR